MRWFIPFWFAVSVMAQDLGSFSNLPFLNAPLKSSVNPGTPPTNVAGLIIWTDVNLQTTNSSGATPSDGQAVAGWTDFSGNNYHLKAHNANGPIYRLTGGPTNGPMIAWTNAMSQAALTNATGGNTYAQPNVVTMVIQINTPVTGACLFNNSGSQTTQINEPGLAIEAYAGINYPGPNNQNNLGHWYVFTAVYNGTTSYWRTNGVSVSGTSSPVINGQCSLGTGSLAGVTLGNYFNYSSTADGQMTALVVYHNLSDTNVIHGVEQWIANENGITIY